MSRKEGGTRKQSTDLDEHDANFSSWKVPLKVLLVGRIKYQYFWGRENCKEIIFSMAAVNSPDLLHVFFLHFHVKSF